MKLVENSTSIAVRCPNCGSFAERRYIADRHLTQTQCPACDYLMVTCSKTGSVVEAYAPGIPVYQ
ncbi:MAG: replication restart DNA helicase PriA [Elainellaceae cyanobacterium]